MFIKSDGEIVFLEIAARPAGGEIVNTLDKTFGFNLYEQTLRNELGLTVCFNTMKNPSYHVWVYLLLPEGKIKQTNTPQFKSHFEIAWNVAIGDTITYSSKSVLRKKAALVTLSNSDFDVLYNDFINLKTFQAVEVE